MSIDTENQQYIYRSSIKLRNGKIIFAKQYGKSAFKIPVRCDYLAEEKTTTEE